MSPSIIIFAFIFVSFLSAYLTRRIWQYTISRSILDIPNERSSHTIPIPRGGGLAMAQALAAEVGGELLQVALEGGGLAHPGIIALRGWGRRGPIARVRFAECPAKMQ